VLLVSAQRIWYEHDYSNSFYLQDKSHVFKQMNILKFSNQMENRKLEISRKMILIRFRVIGFVHLRVGLIQAFENDWVLICMKFLQQMLNHYLKIKKSFPLKSHHKTMLWTGLHRSIFAMVKLKKCSITIRV
jgi:hypothetical protein